MSLALDPHANNRSYKVPPPWRYRQGDFSFGPGVGGT